MTLVGFLLSAPAPALERTRVEVPGADLSAWLYVPEAPGAAPALVVALHGCTQGASDFDDETGWTTLAEELGFVLLLPEQRRRNNALRCFNWMLPGHRVRGRGEPAAIRRLLEAAVRRHGVDRERVFVTGLSAGGAMAAVMMAVYPEVFAAGAVVAGLPYGCVTDATDALSLQAAGVCMRRGNPRVDSPGEWARRVREATDHAGPWPRVSVWHGTGDDVVHPVNGNGLVAQWTALHSVDQEADRVRETARYVHRLYRDREGRAVVEHWAVKGMGHALPVDPGAGCGADPFGLHDLNPWVSDPVQDVGLCASRHIARFWGFQPAR